MDGNGLHADVLHALGHLHNGLARAVPAQAGLDRHRQSHGIDHGGRQPRHSGHILQNGGAGALVDHLLDRASPVDVDEVGPRLLGHARRSHQRLLVMAEDLHAKGALLLVKTHFPHTFVDFPRQSVGGNELRDEHVRPHFFANKAERPVRDALHRGQIDRERELGQHVLNSISHCGRKNNFFYFCSRKY